MTADGAVGDVVGRVAAALARGVVGGSAVALEGAAGAALFLGELARRDARWRAAAHTQVVAAANALAGTGSAGLQYGPAAVLAAVQVAARPGGHYPRLLHTLTSHVAGEQQQRLAADPPGPGVGWSTYDAISGAAGTGRLLLAAVTEGDAQERAAAEPALRDTLRHLVAVARPVTVDGRRLPGWWVPAHRQPTDADRRHFPRGDVNLGLAHGIAGPLALLARSAELGVTVDGQPEAMHRIGDWLADRADHDAYGPYWEPRLPYDDELARARGERTPPSGFAAAESGGAWCYGAAGVATALLRAALVTGTGAWHRLAVAGAHALLARPHTLAHLKGPSLCHGEAGLVQCLWRAGRLAGDAELTGHALALASRLAGQWDADAPYGFRHHAPADRALGWDRAQPLVGEDNPGILEGAAGVGAVLLTALPHPDDPDPVWDRVLLLS
ncbi:lanthionine synthetase C family protein [Kitasatospora sp. NPDC048365]|uniref:lanthionine synthetase C family protein n=1 Tax=Kitasatospora sp. NPDC048365 TaxID=3364050 RepID=UPI003718DB90